MEVQCFSPSTSSSTPSPKANSYSSCHRLSTTSAIDVLKNSEKAFIASGLSSLDDALAPHAHVGQGGYCRGKVHEIWGPSGSGKTSLAIQAALETVQARGSVTWMDAASMLSPPHKEAVMQQLLASKLGPSTTDQRAVDANATSTFRYIALASLSHLLALSLYPQLSFPEPGTSLLVIDGLSHLIDRDYPRYPFSTSQRPEQQKWHAGRRYAVLGSLACALNKIAAVHNLVVLVTTGCSTRMRGMSGLGAALAPGISGAEWEAGVWTRVALFRDFTGRFAGVQKSQGRDARAVRSVGTVGGTVRFEIHILSGRIREAAVSAVEDNSSQCAFESLCLTKTSPSIPVKSSKKRLYDEIADSDDEAGDEYGWQEADEDAAVAGFANKIHRIGRVATEDAQETLQL